jgi:hypothetical protein
VFAPGHRYKHIFIMLMFYSFFHNTNNNFLGMIIKYHKLCSIFSQLPSISTITKPNSKCNISLIDLCLCISSQIFTQGLFQTAIFWVLIPCNFEDGYRRFGGTCDLSRIRTVFTLVSDFHLIF